MQCFAHGGVGCVIDIGDGSGFGELSSPLRRGCLRFTWRSRALGKTWIHVFSSPSP